eukprot:scaffold24337_cov101-Isochrysis_galbana.AAC.2
MKRRSGADDKEPDEVKLGGKRSDEGTESAEVRRGSGAHGRHGFFPCRDARLHAHPPCSCPTRRLRRADARASRLARMPKVSAGAPGGCRGPWTAGALDGAPLPEPPR